MEHVGQSQLIFRKKKQTCSINIQNLISIDTYQKNHACPKRAQSTLHQHPDFNLNWDIKNVCLVTFTASRGPDERVEDADHVVAQVPVGEGP